FANIVNLIQFLLFFGPYKLELQGDQHFQIILGSTAGQEYFCT
ncbi:unnamed protein product, partial [Urochloa humidicola]